MGSWEAPSNPEGLGLAEVRVTVLKTVVALDMTYPHCLPLARVPHPGNAAPWLPPDVMPMPRAGNIPGASLPPDRCYSHLTNMGLLEKPCLCYFRRPEHPRPSRPPTQEHGSAPAQPSLPLHSAWHPAAQKGCHRPQQTNSQFRNPKLDKTKAPPSRHHLMWGHKGGRRGAYGAQCKKAPPGRC